MKVLGFSGYSGAGKTMLIEQLIPRLRAAGQRVSVAKHAHHAFDVDREGKDSWRHRKAGAGEVVVASNQRVVLMRENPTPVEPRLHDLISLLADCDWVLVEGFRHAELPKIEVWRAATGQPAHYVDDRFIVAVATESALPEATTLPVLDLDDPDAVLRFMMDTASRYEYIAPP